MNLNLEVWGLNYWTLLHLKSHGLFITNCEASPQALFYKDVDEVQDNQWYQWQEKHKYCHFLLWAVRLKVKCMNSTGSLSNIFYVSFEFSASVMQKAAFHGCTRWVLYKRLVCTRLKKYPSFRTSGSLTFAESVSHLSFFLVISLPAHLLLLSHVLGSKGITSIHHGNSVSFLHIKHTAGERTGAASTALLLSVLQLCVVSTHL